MCILAALRGAGQPQRFSQQELISACVDLRSNEVPVLFKHWIMGLPGSCLWVQKTNSPPTSSSVLYSLCLPHSVPSPSLFYALFISHFHSKHKQHFYALTNRRSTIHFISIVLYLKRSEINEKWGSLSVNTINNHNIMTSTERQIGYISDLNGCNPQYCVISNV